MANNPVPLKPRNGQVIPPEVRAAADAERERVRREAHEEGKHHGLRIAGIYRDVALVSMGFVVGAVVGAALFLSVYDRGAVTAAAVADQILGRTIADPATTLPPALEVRDPGEAYRGNADAAREGCTPEELRAGRRNCGR